MSKYLIEGQSFLEGELEVSGAKNMVLKVLPATLLCKGESVIYNIPDIEDVKRMLEIIKSIGCSAEQNGSTLRINPANADPKKADLELFRKIRASVMLIAPFLARFGEIYLPHPGGCTLGKRPIDIFIQGFKAFGASIDEDEEGYFFKAKELKGTYFFFPMISVTATESLIMAGVLAKGKTKLENCACEPEIVALCEFLNSCGAKITGVGSHTIDIVGVESLSGGESHIIPDRIEAGSFAVLAAATRSKITIKNCNPSHLRSLWGIFDKMGVNYFIGDDYIKIDPPTGEYKECDVKTHEYPGFVTDLQAPVTVFLTQASGVSMVHETIFAGRLFYTDMLNQMGANIILCDPHRVIVSGKSTLCGKKVVSPDLRAGVAMVIAGLIASGATEIDNCYQIERGYANIVPRLKSIGAKITKID